MSFHRGHRRHTFELAWHADAALNEQCSAQITAHTLQHLRANVHSTIWPDIKPTECALHCVD